MNALRSLFLPRLEPHSSRERRFEYTALALIVIFAVIDILTKNAIVEKFPYGTFRPVIDGFFNLCHVRNFGAAFGQFQNLGTPLLILSIVVFILIIVFMRKLCEGCAERYIALGLILSGIVGNCSDRLFRNPAAVVDFLDFYINFNGIAHHWPAFNVADSCICVGAVIFALSSFIRKDLSKIK